jgi:hypothetical protein
MNNFVRRLALLPLLVGVTAAVAAPPDEADGEGGSPQSPVERQGPRVVAEWEGDPVYQVLPKGQIPAITAPRFLDAEAGDAQMSDEEPILGVVVDGEAHAYSLWQLDAHEIVNDRIAGTALAATW